MSDLSPTSGQKQNSIPKKRLCDFCGESIALLYCRADSAKLCLSCDRQVHSTNQLFTKHTRSLLCDICDASPVSILCFTDNYVLCQNCDWETHSKKSDSSVHGRRPIEGFHGCPSVSELLPILGFEDMGHKALLFSSEKDYLGVSGDYGFSDFLVWETPSVFTLDDLIGDTNSGHGFQAMGVPPPPKYRNTTCGKYKEEILCQLREMAKLEPDFIYDYSGDVDHLAGFQPLVPEHRLQPKDTLIDAEYDTKPNISGSYEASAFQWLSDNNEATNQVRQPSTSLGTYADDCLVPDKNSAIGLAAGHPSGGQEDKPHNPVKMETIPVFPKAAVHEFNSQDRDTALSRYKEKKKTRRYDKHIRYESRKARAESRTRIKGRFAKMNN